MRPQILLDCDGVLADFVGGLLARLKTAGEIDRAITEADITQWDIARALGIDWKTINFYVGQATFVDKLEPYEGALCFVDALREIGDVTIATSPYGRAYHWIPQRLEWLREHFGFDAKDVCVWGQKDRIAGDILIDDSLENAKAFAATGRPVSLLARPWNTPTKTTYRGGLVSRCTNYLSVLDDVRISIYRAERMVAP